MAGSDPIQLGTATHDQAILPARPASTAGALALFAALVSRCLHTGSGPAAYPRAADTALQQPRAWSAAQPAALDHAMQPNPAGSVAEPLTTDPAKQPTAAGSATPLLAVGSARQPAPMGVAEQAAYVASVAKPSVMGAARKPTPLGAADRPVGTSPAAQPAHLGAARQQALSGVAVQPVGVGVAVQPVDVGSAVQPVDMAVAVQPVGVCVAVQPVDAVSAEQPDVAGYDGQHASAGSASPPDFKSSVVQPALVCSAAHRACIGATEQPAWVGSPEAPTAAGSAAQPGPTGTATQPATAATRHQGADLDSGTQTELPEKAHVQPEDAATIILEYQGQPNGPPTGDASHNRSDSLAGTGRASSGRKLTPVAQTSLGQGAPSSVVTGFSFAAPEAVAVIGGPPAMLTPLPTSRASVAVTPLANDTGSPKRAEANRSGPLEPGARQPAVPSDPDPRIGLARPLISDAEPTKPLPRFDATSETALIATRSDIALAISSDIAASPLLPHGQDQPVSSAYHNALADQVAPVLVGILRTTDGTPGVTVRLQPPELGQVQIRVDQTTEGVAHISIAAERSETLQLLQHDAPRLQRALDQAGVLSSGRTISFQVAAPEQVAATASRSDSMPPGSGGSGQGQSGGSWRHDDHSQPGSGRSPDSDQGQARTRWFRAGLDITA